MPHTRPAQASLTLRPVGSLDRPRRPLSRGFGPAGCPSGPLVSYQLNRQLAGWNLPPLVNRALRAHAKEPGFLQPPCALPIGAGLRGDPERLGAGDPATG